MIIKFKLFESNSNDFQIGDIVIYSYDNGKKYDCEIIDINYKYKGFENNNYALIKFKNNNILWSNFNNLELIARGKNIEEKEYKFLEVDPYREEDWEDYNYFKATIRNIKVGDNIYKRINNEYVLMYKIKELRGCAITLNMINKDINVNIHEYFFEYNDFYIKK